MMMVLTGYSLWAISFASILAIPTIATASFLEREQGNLEKPRKFSRNKTRVSTVWKRTPYPREKSIQNDQHWDVPLSAPSRKQMTHSNKVNWGKFNKGTLYKGLAGCREITETSAVCWVPGGICSFLLRQQQGVGGREWSDRAMGSGSLGWRRHPVCSTCQGNTWPHFLHPSHLLPVLPLAKPSWNPEGKSAHWCNPHKSASWDPAEWKRVASGSGGANGRDPAWLVKLLDFSDKEGILGHPHKTD